MKKFRLLWIVCGLLVLATMSLTGCTSEDYESSTDPRLRIIGTWKQTLRNGNSVSDSLYYTFTSDGKVTLPQWKKNDKGWERVDDAIESFWFDEGWTYNEDTDELSGRIVFKHTDSNNPNDTSKNYCYDYKCIIGKKGMLWTGPQGFVDLTCKFERQ